MLQSFLNRPIAHRGLHSNNSSIPENSLIAFQKAIDLNYAIELDVHITADNEVIVFHDDTFERMCGLNKRIQQTTLQEIKELRLLQSDNEIPLLSEVFSLVNSRVPILIEVKNKNKVGRFEEIVLNNLKKYKGDIAIQSFNPMSVGWFAKNASEIIRGQLSSNFKGEKMNGFIKFLLKGMFLNFISKPNFIAFDVEAMPNKKVETLRKKGLPILCWTIKTNEDYKKIKEVCDNIIFEGFTPN